MHESSKISTLMVRWITKSYRFRLCLNYYGRRGAEGQRGRGAEGKNEQFRRRRI